MKYLLFFFGLLFFYSASSQDLAIYTDYLDKVQLFDNGKFREIEHLPLKSYQIGNNSLAYEDNSENFKIYYKDYIFNINSFVTDYKVTDNLVAYNMNKQLNVFDKGKKEMLALITGRFEAGDDLIAFFDQQDEIFKVYYKGNVINLDDALASDEITEFSTGENTLVYLDSENYLNIFYNGEIYELLYKERAKSYKTGRDIVAFVESPMNHFQVFYKGEFYQLEQFEPQSYKIGDGFVAYIDSNDYLKIFINGEIKTVSFDAPGMYKTEDNLLIYTVQGYFKVYWNNQTYTLENYIPSNYVYDMDVIAYEDEQGYLKVFDRGNTQTISYENITTLKCHGHTVYYSYGVKSNEIYYHGEVYSGE